MRKKVAFHTLGCKLNYSETSTIARQFEEGGFERADSSKEVDIHIINSCSVTETADKKCRALIRKLVRQNSDAIIAVTGCYAQLRPEQIAEIEGVDLVVGNNDKERLFEHVTALSGKGKPNIHSCTADELVSFFSSFSSNDRTRSFLKVQDGCNYKCSYCTIPYARGESRNISILEIVARAHEIAAAGQREIVLTGINTGDFGRTTGEKFIDLLIALEQVEGIDRYRISSIEPNLLTDEIISFTAGSDKFMPHFHIPLQSGSDTILKAMRRRYTTAQFAERVAKVRGTMDGVFFGIDVIVGFPGETEDEFQTTYRFLEQLKPAFLHVFPYSERADTPAVNFANKVPQHIKNERVKVLGELNERLHNSFCSSALGGIAEVLVEGRIKGGKMSGYSRNYIRTEFDYTPSQINKIISVQLDSLSDEGGVMGTFIP